MDFTLFLDTIYERCTLINILEGKGFHIFHTFKSDVLSFVGNDFTYS